MAGGERWFWRRAWTVSLRNGPPCPYFSRRRAGGPMAIVEKTVLVEHSAERMFALVERVEDYPQFLPWCGGTEVKSRSADLLLATIHIDYHGITQSFTTENTADPPRLIRIRLVNGPFRELDGTWKFTPLGEHGCKIEFHLRYEFSNRILEKFVGPVFHHIANTFVDAFVRRAEAPG
jgi:ribosome-associated toxin RatA of RatAB toxin-antitoxin module